MWRLGLVKLSSVRKELCAIKTEIKFYISASILGAGELTVREAYKTWKFIEKIKEEDRRGMSQPCGNGGGA